MKNDEREAKKERIEAGWENEAWAPQPLNHLHLSEETEKLWEKGSVVVNGYLASRLWLEENAVCEVGKKESEKYDGKEVFGAHIFGRWILRVSLDGIFAECWDRAMEDGDGNAEVARQSDELKDTSSNYYKPNILEWDEGNTHEVDA